MSNVVSKPLWRGSWLWSLCVVGVLLGSGLGLGGCKKRVDSGKSPKRVAGGFVAALAKRDLDAAGRYLLTLSAIKALCKERASDDKQKAACLADAANMARGVRAQLKWMVQSVPEGYKIGSVQKLSKEQHVLVRMHGVVRLPSELLHLWRVRPRGKPRAYGVLVRLVKQGGRYWVYLPYYRRPKPARVPHWTKELTGPFKQGDY